MVVVVEVQVEATSTSLLTGVSGKQTSRQEVVVAAVVMVVVVEVQVEATNTSLLTGVSGKQTSRQEG